MLEMKENNNNNNNNTRDVHCFVSPVLIEEP
jgi:hypothetical protein